MLDIVFDAVNTQTKCNNPAMKEWSLEVHSNMSKHNSSPGNFFF